jgi:hypothetical protein
MGRADDSYGVLNKGELINTVGNYGTISDCYLQNVIYNFTWPKNKGAETSHIGSEDATDDFSIIFATATVKNFEGSGAVIDGYTNYDKEDWRGVDGAAGHYHCAVDEQRDYLLAPDGTPMMATSDLPESWPAGFMENTNEWPETWHPGPTGNYNSLSETDKALVDSMAAWYDEVYNVWRFWPGTFRLDPKTGKEVPGEFAADRHVWCIMDDQDNLQAPQVGIVVTMEAMSYGRPYAENFHFYDFTIRNISGQSLDSCWWGYYVDPKFGDVDQEEFYTYNTGINPNDKYNVFIQYDPDGQTKPNRWREIGVFGMAALRTPKDVGVTDAHFNPDGGANPTSDWELWAQITGNPSDPHVPVPVSEFFHGPDPHFDDFSLSWGNPRDYGFMVMSGPFNMEIDETVKATIVVSAGSDRVELLSDKKKLESGDFAKNIAIAQDMFDVNFLGPAGPPAPTLYGVSGEGKIILYWDSAPERQPDPFTGNIDFEGYKIYRSIDDGASWGKPVTDAKGNVVGYVPLAQFDIKNDIEGLDILNANTYLGSNTGLTHVFIDSTVENGVKYTYAITSYDRGEPDRNIPSFESARGTNPIERNVVQLTPRSNAIGLQDPTVEIENASRGKGELSIKVYDPPANKLHFTVSFSDSPATEFNVIQDGVILSTLPMNSDIVLPPVKGISMELNGDTLFGGIRNVVDEYGRSIIGTGNPDTTGNWYVENVELVPNTQADFEARVADYEIRFTSDSSWAAKAGPDPQLAEFKVPFSVWNVSCEPHIRTNCIIAGSDKKWDYGDPVYISGTAYNATLPGDTISGNWREDFPYRLLINSTANNTDKIKPLEGQVVNFTTYRGFTPLDSYEVYVGPVNYIAGTSEMEQKLNEVRVVPNPYVVNARWETVENERRLQFMFLPPECDISIYTVVGELVTKIHHNNGTGDESWNLLSQVGQEIAYGMYIYVIEANDSNGISHKKVGKFIVIK